MEDYLRVIAKEREVFQIEPKIVIALDEGENEMKIDVISNKSKKPQIGSEEDQSLVLVQPPTLPCTFGTPYKGVKVREHSQIFYTANTFVLDDPDATDSFMLEVPNELLNLKDGLHASLPKYVDAPFVVDISKGEGDILKDKVRNKFGGILGIVVGFGWILRERPQAFPVRSGSFWRETKRFGILSKLALRVSAVVRVWTGGRGRSSLAAP
ncbi:hypothetical protein Syun_009804 [Stephania yunnanensis]|uniref:Uncharacterized protein n=1 Tax=Stephania yunnanensis TaxID=152371 RepID=A0AAP0PR70_9MAGN